MDSLWRDVDTTLTVPAGAGIPIFHQSKKDPDVDIISMYITQSTPCLYVSDLGTSTHHKHVLQRAVGGNVRDRLAMAPRLSPLCPNPHTTPTSTCAGERAVYSVLT